jgi:hypothetical protein
MSTQYHSLTNQNNIDVHNIAGMITLLKDYERMCLDKQDFSSAH